MLSQSEGGGGKLDALTPPSESYDREEVVVLIGQSPTGNITHLLPIHRLGNGKFWNLSDAENMPADSFEGRFAGMLPPIPADEKTRQMGKMLLEAMGESVLLRKTANQAVTGSIFVPPDTARSLDVSQMKELLFGSDLSYADVLENFFAWEHQTIVGTEVVDRVNCQILESKPGRSDRSAYATVRSWVDVRRFVPLRVEKYLPSGQLARRIESGRIVTDDIKRHVPASLTLRDPRTNSVTELDGSRLKHDVTFTDHEFTAAGLKEIVMPRSAPE